MHRVTPLAAAISLALASPAAGAVVTYELSSTVSQVTTSGTAPIFTDEYDPYHIDIANALGRPISVRLTIDDSAPDFDSNPASGQYDQAILGFSVSVEGKQMDFDPDRSGGGDSALLQIVHPSLPIPGTFDLARVLAELGAGELGPSRPLVTFSYDLRAQSPVLSSDSLGDFDFGSTPWSLTITEHDGPYTAVVTTVGQFNAVPEPAAAALFGLGAAVLVARRSARD